LTAPKLKAAAAVIAAERARKYVDHNLGRTAYISSLQYGRIGDFPSLSGLPDGMLRTTKVWLVQFADPSVKVSTGLPKGCRSTGYVINATLASLMATVCLDS
jgi:hypothetical protein